jgi:glycerol kinase
VLAVAQREFTQHFPASGWVEHDPEEIWTSVVETTRQALAKAGVEAACRRHRHHQPARDRRGLGPGDRRAIHRAIVWQDRRTSAACAAARPRATRRWCRLAPASSSTPISPEPSSPGSSTRCRGARSAPKRGELAFGTIDSFLLWRLTGGRVHATDATNAARTMLFDIHRGVWDEDLCRLFDVPMPAMLPQVMDCAAAFGTTDPALFGGAIAVGGIAGDQQAATVGQACFAPGMMKSTYGTGCFALLNTGAEAVASRNKLLTTIAYQLEGPADLCAGGLHLRRRARRCNGCATGSAS